MNFHISPEAQAILEPVIVTLVTTFFTALTGLITVLASKAYTQLQDARGRLTSDQRAALEIIIGGVVKAAEQMGISKQIEDTAKAKKAWAIQRVQEWCDTNKIKVDANMIEVILEGKILEGVHKGWRPPVYTPEVPPFSAVNNLAIGQVG